MVPRNSPNIKEKICKRYYQHPNWNSLVYSDYRESITSEDLHVHRDATAVVPCSTEQYFIVIHVVVIQPQEISQGLETSKSQNLFRKEKNFGKKWY